MRLYRGLVLTSLLFALACSSSNDNNTNGGDNDAAGDNGGGDTFSAEALSTADLCAIIAESEGPQDSECGVTFTTLTPEQLSAECAAGGSALASAQTIVDSYNAGRVSIDWAKARQCNAEARTLRSANSPVALSVNADWIALRKTGACAGIAVGKVGTGGACTSEIDCTNATDECSQDAPYTATTFTCRPLATLGHVCDNVEVHCAPGLGCPAGLCVASASLCSASTDCVDGLCVDGACVANGSVPLGGACPANISCAGYCSACSQLPSEDHLTCKTIQGSGGACASSNDCADGLGCTANVCTTVAAGGDCGEDDVCANDAFCGPGFNCGPLNETDCGAHAPYCAFDSGTSLCKADKGKCVVLPTSGACEPSYFAASSRCADGFDCVADDGQCHAAAALSAACDNSHDHYPSCADGLECVGNVCVAACASNSDCSSGQYCNHAVQPSVCAGVITDDCNPDSNAACGDNKFCASPTDVCAAYADQTACNADSDCSWNGGTSACDAGGAAHTHCLAYRQAGQNVIGTCFLGGGSFGYTGNIGASPVCAESLCYDDGSTPAICITTPRGCLNLGSAEAVALSFIFGLVRLRRRKKQ